MPSPFPGMDPYLEDPILWPGVHQSLISQLAYELNDLLPETYAAEMGERVYVETAGQDQIPDISIVERRDRHPVASGIAVLPDPSIRLTILPVQHREVFVNVLSLKPKERIVAVIEVLSPTNKRPGSNGRKLYLRKQKSIVCSDVHLIELDLLRSGSHTVAVPESELLKLGRRDYLALLHYADNRCDFDAWGLRVRDRLPKIWVPLTGRDPGVTVDLQSCFDRTYERGAFARRLDYDEDPPHPLATDDAAWADALLRDRGLRN